MIQETQVRNMWSGVNPRIFERGSFPMLFKRMELLSVAHSVAELVAPKQGIINNLYLIGCATANREIRAIQHANESLAQNIFVKNLHAVDIAPQLLKVARRRIGHMHALDVVGDYSVENMSAEKVHFEKSAGNNTAFLGLYDLHALINDGQEKNGEPLGLDEYSGAMRGVLGELTQITPITFSDGVFNEGDEIVSYDNSTDGHDNKEITHQLRSYHSEYHHICAMRVAIKHKADSDSPVFISTWFNLGVLQSIFRDLGLKPTIHPLDCRKGAVLELHDKNFNNDYGSDEIVFALNNVYGNLATDQILTEFTNNVVAFCNY